MKKALQLASVASMIDQFNMPNIELLQSLGYHVDVIADFNNPGNISAEKSESLIKQLESRKCSVFSVGIPRKIKLKDIWSAYRTVKRIISEEQYDLIHCHSPIGGAIARLAAKKERKKGTKVIYTAHGFHFYNGAPLKNWLVFYPIEKILSYYTDVLITINKEDFEIAKRKFHAKNTVYIPGIGIDTRKFMPDNNGKDVIRNELGIDDNRLLLLSVGELNDNKNHSAVISAIKDLPLTYVIVGKGILKDKLNTIAEKNNVDLRLVGFRSDVYDFYKAADVYVLPSKREGLNVSLMEAMSCGLPVACSNIRGNIDLVDSSGGVLFDPNNIVSIREAIIFIINNRNGKGDYNAKKIKAFDVNMVLKKMHDIYEK